jgi:hypothetical protein
MRKRKKKKKRRKKKKKKTKVMKTERKKKMMMKKKKKKKTKMMMAMAMAWYKYLQRGPLQHTRKRSHILFRRNRRHRVTVDVYCVPGANQSATNDFSNPARNTITISLLQRAT